MKCKNCKENTRKDILDNFNGLCEECYVEINGEEIKEEYPEECFGD